MEKEKIEEVRQQMLNEVVRIGDNLITTAIKDSNTYRWKTISVTGTDVVWHESKDIYRGVGGICLFLAELYTLTNDNKYLDAAELGTQWILSEVAKKQPATYSLYTGDLSITLLLLRLNEITKKKHYLQNALEISLGSEAFLNYPIYDLINGIGGTLLGLLHVHAATQDESLLSLIDAYIKRMLSTMKASDKGVYWDRLSINIRALCGFSHGASGFAFVFQELGYYFKNPVFFEIAMQSFLYEDQFYDDKNLNWMDWRCLKDQVKNATDFEDAYLTGNHSFFAKPSFMNAWCHGASGIGLARLRSLELFPASEAIKAKTISCLASTHLTDIEHNITNSACLCHGSAGNAELFLLASSVLNEPKYLEWSYEVASKLLKMKNDIGRYISGNPNQIEDDGMFMGTTGIGYFFLRLLNPDQIHSILSLNLRTQLRVNSTKYEYINLCNETLRQALIKTCFPRTLYLCNKFYQQQLSTYLSEENDPDFINSWVDFIKNRLPSQDKKIEDVFQMELSILNIHRNVQSDILLHYKDKRKSHDISSFAAGKGLSDVLLITDSDAMIITTKWNWQANRPDIWDKNLTAPQGEQHVLITPLPAGVRERNIAGLAVFLLEFFQDGARIDDLMNDLQVHVDIADESKTDETRIVIKNQINELFEAGLLVDASKHPLNIRRYPLFDDRS